MTSPGLPIEFYMAVNRSTDRLEQEIQDCLADLSAGHSDITGASVSIVRQSHRHRPHLYRASVRVYTHPKNIHAQEKHENMHLAVKAALDRVRRQIQERREKHGEHRK